MEFSKRVKSGSVTLQPILVLKVDNSQVANHACVIIIVIIVVFIFISISAWHHIKSVSEKATVCFVQ